MTNKKAQISNLINAGESETIKFKTSFGREAVESLVAFANTGGGTTLVGVQDNGVPCGVTIGKETLNQWLGQIKASTAPAIIPDIKAHVLSGRTIVSIYVSEYPVKPVNTRGRYFKRVANTNQQLSLTEINDFYMQSLHTSWDAHVVGNTSFDDLGVGKIETIVETVSK